MPPLSDGPDVSTCVEPDVTCVVCSVRGMHGAGYEREGHVCSRGEPLGSRGLIFLCAGDVMAACTCAGSGRRE